LFFSTTIISANKNTDPMATSITTPISLVL
jgi:hypothetical protein